MSEPRERRPRLLVRRSGKEVAFDAYQRETWIGSHRSCDLVLGGEGVKPRHARIEWQGARVYLFALEGEVSVGGTPRQEWLLRDGDVLRLGSVEVVFRFVEPVVATAEPVEPPPRAVVEPTPVTPRAESVRVSERRAGAPASKARRILPFLPFLAALLVLGYLVARRLDAPSEKKEPLDRYVLHAILPLEDLVEREPRAARLLRHRCEAFLSRHPESPSRERVKRALEKAEAVDGGGPDWEFGEVRLAVVEIAPPEALDALLVLDEKVEILRTYLATAGQGSEGNREQAAAWLEECERALRGLPPE